MTYYILGKGEPSEHLAYSTNILGEESLGSFYWEDGYPAMLNILDMGNIEDFNIFDEQGTTYTIEEFTDVVTQLKMKRK